MTALRNALLATAVGFAAYAAGAFALLAYAAHLMEKSE